MTNERFRIYLLSSWFPHQRSPIQGVFVREQARATLQYDDLIVLHIQEGIDDLARPWQMVAETDPQLSAGLNVYHVYIRRTRLKALNYIFYMAGAVHAFWLLYRRYGRPDLLHAHEYRAGVPAAWLKKILRLPLIITEHSSEFTRQSIPPGRLKRARQAFKIADRVLPVSRFLQKKLESYHIQANFTVIPNVVDTQLFYPAQDIPQNSPLKLICIASLVEVKGIPNLLHGLAQLNQVRQDWQLDLIGDGPLRAEYQNLINELGLEKQVFMRGYHTKAEIANFLRSADLFVLSSLVETFSVATIEALACGLPVLVTRCGGPEEYITSETGRLVRVNDPEDLSQGLTWMLSHLNEFDRQKIAANAQAQFSAPVIGSRLHALYTSLIKENCS